MRGILHYSAPCTGVDSTRNNLRIRAAIRCDESLVVRNVSVRHRQHKRLFMQIQTRDTSGRAKPCICRAIYWAVFPPYGLLTTVARESYARKEGRDKRVCLLTLFIHAVRSGAFPDRWSCIHKQTRERSPAVVVPTR